MGSGLLPPGSGRNDRRIPDHQKGDEGHGVPPRRIRRPVAFPSALRDHAALLVRSPVSRDLLFRVVLLLRAVARLRPDLLHGEGGYSCPPALGSPCELRPQRPFRRTPGSGPQRRFFLHPADSGALYRQYGTAEYVLPLAGHRGGERRCPDAPGGTAEPEGPSCHGPSGRGFLGAHLHHEPLGDPGLCLRIHRPRRHEPQEPGGPGGAPPSRRGAALRRGLGNEYLPERGAVGHSALQNG